MAQTETKKKNLPLLITAVVLACVAIVGVLLGTSGKNNDAEQTAGMDSSQSSGAGSTQVVAEGGSLVIPASEVTETASFYPVEVDGTEMEVLAIRDSSGNIRTAFNTCQSCYTSGRGYYIANGNILICQNCGSQFTAEQVQTQAGGCNPYPIFAENKEETADAISISYDFLKQSASVFANWKI